MELKTIPVKEVYSNFSQPREHFDKEKIKELAESILGNGLISPITVRNVAKGKGKYMIVAGERRTMAHRVAGLKNISAFVKTYKNDGEWMIESLIENIHRENLAEFEKAKYLSKIKEIEKLNLTQLAKRVGIGLSTAHQLLDLVSPSETHISKAVQKGDITEHHFRVIKKVEGKETQKKVLEKIKKEDLSSAKTEKLTSTIRKSPEEVKEALLDDKISVEQAERITKLDTPKQRQEAIKQHEDIERASKSVERSVKWSAEQEKKDKELEKKMVKSSTFIAGFRTYRILAGIEVEKALKQLLKCVAIISILDDKQKRKLLGELARFNQFLEKGLQLSQQIQDKIDDL